MLKSMLYRKLISLTLGSAFGFFNAYIFWVNVPFLRSTYNFWGSALMWNFVFNGVLIGLVVSFAGIITIKRFKSKVYSAIRGACTGSIVSIQIAFLPSILNIPQKNSMIFILIILGSMYGVITDFVASGFGGDGEEMFRPRKLKIVQYKNKKVLRLIEK